MEERELCSSGLLRSV